MTSAIGMAKGMNDVERFDPCLIPEPDDNMIQSITSDMEPATFGDYVRYTDYAALQQQLAAAREEIRVYQMFEQLVIGEGAFERFNELRSRAENAEAEAKAAREAMQAAEADAARYRWLKARSWGGSGSYYFTGPKYSGDMNLDAAIDATLQRYRQP